jgi:hypothetical protein
VADLIPFTSENGVSPEEQGVSTRPFVLAQASSKEHPWSKYVPFPKGTQLQVEGSALGFQFKGTGKVGERTDAQLDFSVSVPVALPLSSPVTVSVQARITYVAEGGRNFAEFTINGVRSNKTISIQSTPTERILTAPGGLEISTGLAFPDKVTLNAVRMKPSKDQVEIEAQFAGLIPSATIRASQKPAGASPLPP